MLAQQKTRNLINRSLLPLHLLALSPSRRALQTLIVVATCCAQFKRVYIVTICQFATRFVTFDGKHRNPDAICVYSIISIAKRSAVGTHLEFKTLKQRNSYPLLLLQQDQLFRYTSNFAPVASCYLVPEPFVPRGDDGQDNRAHSSTAAVVKQDTDGVYVKNTRPLTFTFKDHTTRYLRETSPEHSVQ